MSTRTASALAAVIAALAAGSVVLAVQGHSFFWAVAAALTIAALHVVRRARGRSRSPLDFRTWRGWATLVGTFLVLTFVARLAAGDGPGDAAGQSVMIAAGLGIGLAMLSPLRFESDA